MTPSRPTRLPAETWKRTLVSGFIAFNVAAAVFSTHKPAPERNWAERFFHPYLLRTRLFQEWYIYGPVPRPYRKEVFAKLIFADGTKTRWRRPTPPNWDFFERHLSYNFQKWDSSSPYLETYSWLQEDLAGYLERQFRNDNNPLRVIEIYLATADIPPPNETGRANHGDDEFKWTETLLLHHKVISTEGR